jgi:hypothetical protein
VQVAAGVLSGLSYILEKGRTPGYYPPLSMDTDYMIEKARPLLGHFFMEEIKPSLFPGFTDKKYKRTSSRKTKRKSKTV